MMGLTWAAGWAACGLGIGVASVLLPWLPWGGFFRVFDAPLPALGVPGFFGGAFFSLVLGIAGRRRRFEDLSLPHFALWGALGGVLLSLFPAALVMAGLATPNSDDPGLWRFTSVIVGPLTLLSALSAATTLVIARKSQARPAAERLSEFDDAEFSAGEGWALEEGRMRDAGAARRDAEPVGPAATRRPPTH